MKGADKINRTIQGTAGVMTKEAQANNPGSSYVLNSYAFHCRPLINTISTFLPAGFEKSKIENLFVETNEKENHNMFE